MPEVTRSNPLTSFLQHQGVMILDGGLATELESRGWDLDDDLWSARVLMEDPDAIKHVHLDYLRAGADCITSSSYQATIGGFVNRGCSDGEAVDLLRRSVALACEARDEFWADRGHRRGRLRPIVAASIGPYGAFLADGSEFRGQYGLDREQLIDFHRRRWMILADAGADLLACETIPCRIEARALADLAELTPDVPVWLSFSCRTSRHLNDGTPIADAVADVDPVENIIALGVNCTAPDKIAGLLEILEQTTDRPLVAYPNSGEIWDPRTRCWLPETGETRVLPRLAGSWRQLGARLLGGCCRIRPDDIAAMRQTLLG